MLSKRYHGIIQDVSVRLEIKFEFKEAHSVKTRGIVVAFTSLKSTMETLELRLK